MLHKKTLWGAVSPVWRTGWVFRMTRLLGCFEYSAYAQSIGYNCKYVVAALQAGGLDVRLRHIRRELPLPELPNGAIVFLERSALYPYQHYLLKVEEGWVDPWINMHDCSDVKYAKVGVRQILPGRAY